MMTALADDERYYVECIDGVKGLESLPNSYVKLIYGSPPYPNAERNYGTWDSKQYLGFISPFIEAGVKKLRSDGFFIINIKANRDKHKDGNTTRSLIVERLAILMEEKWNLHCVDIEIWLKSNPVPTGLRCACQDCYEQVLWFSIDPHWKINLDDLRRPYCEETLKTYKTNEYKPRSNGLSYVRKIKKIKPTEGGALPKNVIFGGISNKRKNHQAIQPNYISKKYIQATTNFGDIVVDPWMGTGTTGVESLNLGRRFIGFDIESEYVKMAQNDLEIQK